MDLFQIIHLICYLIALFPAVYVSFSIDYTKFIKAKSNLMYYVSAIMLTMVLTLLVGEFIYNLSTMFIN